MVDRRCFWFSIWRHRLPFGFSPRDRRFDSSVRSWSGHALFLSGDAQFNVSRDGKTGNGSQRQQHISRDQIARLTYAA
jgi:hypothetical protein